MLLRLVCKIIQFQDRTHYGFLTITEFFESRNEYKASIIELVKGKHSCSVLNKYR